MPQKSAQRMAEGARLTHQLRTKSTELKILTALLQMQADGEEITKTAIAKKVGINSDGHFSQPAHIDISNILAYAFLNVFCQDYTITIL